MNRQGMERLVEVIGPAPSEGPPEVFRRRLAEERLRVGRELDAFRQRAAAPSRRAAAAKGPSVRDKAAKLEEIEKRLAAQGLSLEEVMKK